MEQNNQKLIEENQILKERIEALKRLNQELVDQNKELIEEIKKHEDSLSFLNSQIAHDLKIKKAKSLRYKMVTVLFSDVRGFTKLSEHQDAEALIDELDAFFFEYDSVVVKNNIEKIKTIGDSYMCAGGIPKKNRTNPIEVVMAALDMQIYMQKLQKKYQDENKKIWDITTGIHTGAVIATTTGKKKISYELSGETVNIASRIESSSDHGKITISEVTYEFVKDYFVCEWSGKMPVKYAGDINMYIVKGYRPELSIGEKGLLPNDRFRHKLQIIRYDDLYEYMLDRLEKELPKHLYYHNLKHTIDVTIGVEIIGTNEGIDEKEMLLLKTAALFHDSGQIYGSVGHEERGCQIIRESLPEWGYDEQQIEIICEIIMATKLPPTPKNKLQQIICDADLDYLGRADFIPVSDTLYRELKVQGLVGSLNDWNKVQVKFLTGHQFFTDTAIEMRQVSKENQVERIKTIIT